MGWKLFVLRSIILLIILSALVSVYIPAYLPLIPLTIVILVITYSSLRRLYGKLDPDLQLRWKNYKYHSKKLLHHYFVDIMSIAWFTIYLIISFFILFILIYNVLDVFPVKISSDMIYLFLTFLGIEATFAVLCITMASSKFIEKGIEFTTSALELLYSLIFFLIGGLVIYLYPSLYNFFPSNYFNVIPYFATLSLLIIAFGGIYLSLGVVRFARTMGVEYSNLTDQIGTSRETRRKEKESEKKRWTKLKESRGVSIFVLIPDTFKEVKQMISKEFLSSLIYGVDVVLGVSILKLYSYVHQKYLFWIDNAYLYALVLILWALLTIVIIGIAHHNLTKMVK